MCSSQRHALAYSEGHPCSCDWHAAAAGCPASKAPHPLKDPGKSLTGNSSISSDKVGSAWCWMETRHLLSAQCEPCPCLGARCEPPFCLRSLHDLGHGLDVLGEPCPCQGAACESRPCLCPAWGRPCHASLAKDSSRPRTTVYSKVHIRPQAQCDQATGSHS